MSKDGYYGDFHSKQGVLIKGQSVLVEVPQYSGVFNKPTNIKRYRVTAIRNHKGNYLTLTLVPIKDNL